MSDTDTAMAGKKKYLAPGIWIEKGPDGKDEMHFNFPVILRQMGLEDTPENQEMLQQQLHRVMSEEMPNCKLTEAD